MNLENEFVPYEQALALKELGFDKECFAGYDIDTTELHIGYENDQKTFNIEYYILAPLYQQAFRWFRDMYNLMIPIYKDDIDQYYFSIPNSDRLLDTTNYCSESYEEAELECLKKLIELLKTNKI